jgi:hypothetical protein
MLSQMKITRKKETLPGADTGDTFMADEKGPSRADFDIME